MASDDCIVKVMQKNWRPSTKSAALLCPCYSFAATPEARATWKHGDPPWWGRLTLPNLSKSCLKRGTATRKTEPIFSSRVDEIVSVLSFTDKFTWAKTSQKIKNKNNGALPPTFYPPLQLILFVSIPAFLCYSVIHDNTQRSANPIWSLFLVKEFRHFWALYQPILFKRPKVSSCCYLTPFLIIIESIFNKQACKSARLAARSAATMSLSIKSWRGNYNLTWDCVRAWFKME